MSMTDETQSQECGCEYGAREDKSILARPTDNPAADLEALGFNSEFEVERQVDTLLVADLRLPGGSSMQFWADPRRRELGVVETGPDEESQPTLILSRTEDMPIIDLYLGLTTRSHPVPKILMEFGDALRQSDVADERYVKLDDLYGNRLTSDLPEGEVEVVELEDLDFASGPASLQKAKEGYYTFAWNCQKGADAFADQFCTGTGSITKCGNLARPSYLHDTGKNNKKKKSIGIGVFCNTYFGVIKHKYQFWGVWYTPISIATPGNRGTASWWHGDVRLRRQVWYGTSAGYTRLRSSFIN